MLVLGKCGMTPCAVDRDAKNLSFILLKLGKNLVVQRHLVAAHWAPVGGIKRQHDRLATQIVKR
jgi:hypothetical protein